MSRSRKKNCYVWISKRWDRWKQRAFRRQTKMQLDEMKFDPDKDWLEAQVTGEYGTRCGWDVKPGPNDSEWQHESYESIMRK